ncbi:hypothetical protein GcM3_198001 [Golovinomyces cichoracearum]|uniref:SWR1-complex protein 3 domain-containing protein n=1 Tax=Golovinomyces cichoracearum TaxID=62708 RepID=A0A420HEX4_9PEZI|nr:hypothetical protein GcM3_198001 [Golovinomyces cichoracearum]
MERKRKLPARAARVESGSKKRTITPPESQSKSAISELQTEAPSEKISLPTSITSGKPLPTVTQPQPTDLSLKDQDEANFHSGVLTESLNRSRQKWTTEGIFEKYWTKVRKGKNAPGESQRNPPKESMAKLGTCTMTVEPHTFEVTLYAVKDPTSRTLGPNLAAMPRPVLEYGPPARTSRPETPCNSQPTNMQPLQGLSSGTKNSVPFSLVNNRHTSSPGNVVSNSLDPQPISTSIQSAASLTNQSPLSQGKETAFSKGTDPVIQMLAQRAGTDSELKNVMRMVANGQATPEQLANFQNHIDELTKLHQSQQLTQPSNSVPSVTSDNNPVSAPPCRPAQSLIHSGQDLPPNSYTSTPSIQKQLNSPALRCKGPITSNKSEIVGVVLEFSNGNGDRYSFPKYSILEFIPGTNQVIASFLIIRKGSDADSLSYNPDLDYYQPISIRIYAHQSRQLDAIQKAVESPQEVRRWMNKVMDECQRAEYVLLAMRLPREIDHSSTIKEEDLSNKNGQINTQVNWEVTRGHSAASKLKSNKRTVTEDEHYQNFINTISAVT